MELIEISLEEAHKLQRAGYMSLQHYQDCKATISQGMLMFGDSFLKSLGQALFHAEVDDSLKILRYWGQVCDQHALLYKMFKAKQDAGG